MSPVHLGGGAHVPGKEQVRCRESRLGACGVVMALSLSLRRKEAASFRLPRSACSYIYLPSKHTSRCISRTDRCRKKEARQDGRGRRDKSYQVI